MKLASVVTILLLHGGSFNGGNPSTVAPLARDLRGDGYRVIVVPYRDRNPNGNILDQIDTVKGYAANAKLRGPVVTYGVSAGATLAAALASRGEVDGAIVAGGPMNLLTWFSLDGRLAGQRYWIELGMSREDRRNASPYYRIAGKQSPQLMLYGDIDPLVNVEQGISYARVARKGQPDTSIKVMPFSAHWFPERFRSQARAWIRQRWAPR